MNERIVFIDTETGGVDPEVNSLLSIGFVIWDTGKIIYEEEIFIKDITYRVNSRAMAINKIDISKLDQIGVNKIEAIRIIKEIKKRFFDNSPMTLAGHNVAFDASFIKQLYKECHYCYSDDFLHRMIDTASILKFMNLCEVIPQKIFSSDEAFEYFSIDVQKRHTALDDCRATAVLFNELLMLAKTKMKS